MAKNTIIIRAYPAGTPSTGEDYEILLHADDGMTTLDDGTTDADGQIIYDPDGSPGPFYWEVTDGDVTRSGSTKSSGSGGSYSLAEIPIALRALGPGVIDGYKNELACTDPDSGPNISMGSGAVISGNGILAVWHSTGPTVHAVSTAQDGTNPKACYLCIETSGPGEDDEGRAEIVDICGAAAASPALPTPTQTDALWQEPLYSFVLGNSGSSDANDITSLTDVRKFVPTRSAVVSGAGRREDPTVEQSITSTTTGDDVVWTSGSPNLTLANGVTYDLEAECFLMVKAPSGQTISIAIALAGLTTGTFISSATSSDHRSVMNVRSAAAVVGTGASVTNTVKAKVSGGTGKVAAGYLYVRAVPRR